MVAHNSTVDPGAWVERAATERLSDRRFQLEEGKIEGEKTRKWDENPKDNKRSKWWRKRQRRRLKVK